MTYKEYIHNIIKTRGQYNCQGYFERHHIIPKCLGGEGDARTKHENIIWLYPREHFEAHRLLALEHSDNYSLVYAFHMMSTMSKDIDRKIEITAEEYEEARLLWLPFCKYTASVNAKGRKWYNDGVRSYFAYEPQDGWLPGRCNNDKLNIGKSSKGRVIGRGKHTYNNGVIQKQFIDGDQPEGWQRGALPMSESAKKAHSESLKGKNKFTKANRGFESYYSVSKRIDITEFINDFINIKLSKDEMIAKYNLTTNMWKKLVMNNGYGWKNCGSSHLSEIERRYIKNESIKNE